MAENNHKSGPSPMIVEQAKKMYAYIMANAYSCNPIPCKLACQRAIYFIYNVEVDGYSVPPAIITSAVKSTKMVNGGLSELKDALSMYAKAMGTDFTVKQATSNTVFNPALLNTDIDMEKLAIRLCQSKSCQFSLCWYGVPGTGKSAYARYIAQKMNMEVIEKKPRICWVPMLEKPKEI